MKNRVLSILCTVCLLFTMVVPTSTNAASTNYYISDGTVVFHYALTKIGTSAVWKTRKAKNYPATKKGVVQQLMAKSDAPPIPEPDAPFVGWANGQTADGKQIIKPTYEQTTCYKDLPTNSINVWARFNYKVTVNYDANGGTVNGKPTYEETQAETTIGRRHFVDLKSFVVPTAVRSGYKFLGWKCDNPDIGSTVSPGQSIKPIVRYTNLVAMWEEGEEDTGHSITPTPTPSTEYYLRYDANGGELGSVPEKEEMKTYGATYITKFEPTREIHVFKCWNTERDGSGTSYEKEELFKKSGKKPVDTTLYAQWECAFAPEKITYNANGGVLGEVPPEVEITYPNVAYITSKEPSRGDLRFLGWNTKMDGSGKSYSGGDLYKESNTEPIPVTLYAQWEETRTLKELVN